MHPLPPAPWYSPWEAGLFSLGLFAFLCLGFILAMLMVSSLIGEKRYSKEKMRPYECGVIPTGTARLRYPVPFYLLAIFFLLFDVEGAFIFSWAVAFRDLGWQGCRRGAGRGPRGRPAGRFLSRGWDTIRLLFK